MAMLGCTDVIIEDLFWRVMVVARQELGGSSYRGPNGRWGNRRMEVRYRARWNDEHNEHEQTTQARLKHTVIYPASGLTEGDNTPTAASMVYMMWISQELQWCSPLRVSLEVRKKRARGEQSYARGGE